jgi:DNA-binding CsgD family transcriptional regulator
MNRIDEQFEAALKREALAEHERLPEPEPLKPDAPAPRLAELAAEYGHGLTARALEAWGQRLQGASMIDVAHQLGISIESARALIKEVHDVIFEDLKENLELNRSLDLARIDQLLAAHMPKAKAGKVRSAQLCLRALERRSKLTGIEPLPDPGRSHPQNVLIWLQTQLPSINRIVDSLPPELPPSAPGS